MLVRDFRPAAAALVLGLALFSPHTPLLAQITSVSRSATADSAAEREKLLASLFDEYWQNNLKDGPEFASSIGDKRYNDQLTDYSIATINRRLARDFDLLQRIAAVDDTGLSDQVQLSRRLLLRQLVEWQQGARFDVWQMPVTQFSGFHTSLPQLADQMTFETAKDYDDYIARLHQVPRVFTQNTDNMELGAESGRIPPKYLLEKVLVQVKNLATQKPEDSPFAAPLKKFPSSISAATQARIRRETLDAISTDVLPAYQRFARFLEVSYVPKGRTDPGIWAIPDGDAFYAYLIRSETTTDQTAEQIHSIGVAQVAGDEKELQSVVTQLGFKDIHALAESIKANPALHAKSADDLVNRYRTYIDGMQKRLPDLFSKLPTEKLVVEPIPAYLDKDQAAAYYEGGSIDAHRPGKVRVNTYNFADRSLAPVEAIAYHEGVPGHHLQVSTGLEMTGVPIFRRYLGYDAFSEGWALYSERLGKDIGFYSDPYSNYGRLDNDMWRSARLVVDTGVHSQHWSREQMVKYFRDHTAMDDINIQAEVDRYIAMPAQALAYKSGQLKILELRDYARQQLGARFDLKQFHDQVIDSGALPLDVLDERIHSWVTQQKQKP
jgi:uncharacterized protein (DUF885 family)